MTTPDKLSDDPIVEALLEIRFKSAALREEIAGRLLDVPLWNTAIKRHLPAAELPDQVRSANPSLQYLPTIEVKGAPGFGAVRIGSNVLSLHFLPPYEGWEAVFPRICDTVREAFGRIPDLSVTRLGLRYINAFTKERHHVGSVHDLAVQVRVSDESLTSPLILTFDGQPSPAHKHRTRLISREFIGSGKLPDDSTVLADIDVFTPDGYAASTPDVVCEWVNDAHTHEKRAFRRLLPDDLFEKLRERGDDVQRRH